MKNFLFLLFILFISDRIVAQESVSFYREEWEMKRNNLPEQFRLEIDQSIDVIFYHPEISIAIDSQYISGNVFIKLVSKVDKLNKVKLNLHSSMKVDKVTMDGVSFSVTNDEVEVDLNKSYNKDELIKLKIFYHGKPVLAGGYKGLVYTTHGAGEPLIVTLSTPFLAHYWFPCKDGPQDKADSMYMDVTIKDTTVNGLKLIAVSNGILEAIDSSVVGQRTFSWRHRYPIVPYYIMVAISNFRTIKQTYTGVTSSFPLIYYVFNENYTASVTGVNELHAVLNRFSELFGDYPFSNEKYGITELGFYGGIENQTNTIQNNLTVSAFYISVHELAHQWFADMITCSDWHHAWLNEGFASYAEALIKEYFGGRNDYMNYMTKFEFYNGGTVYLPSDSDAFNIFQSVIYNKGAYVLHMLRGMLGDSVFFKCIHDYATNPAFRYANATTEDFEQICKNVSGKNLQTFFQQWIYDEYYPVYKYNFTSFPSDHSTILTIRQDQELLYGWRSVFEMPLQIQFNFSSGKDTLVTVINNQQFQSYEFSFTDSVIAATIDPDKWVLKNADYDAGVAVYASVMSNDNNFVIYPNPAENKIHLFFSNKHQSYLRCEIQNVFGGKVFEQIISINDLQYSVPIDISYLEKGIYFLTVTVEGEQQVRRIVKL